MGCCSGDLVVRLLLRMILFEFSLTNSFCRASSGFKLHVSNLKSLSLTLGPNTTAPLTSLGISVDYQPFVTVNVSEGVNEIDVTGANPTSSVVRFNVEEWQDNRMNLESIQLDSVRCIYDVFTTF